MKVAVLGGSGYLASIISYFNHKKKNFIFFSRNSKNENLKIDYLSFQDVNKKLNNFDCVINLAGISKTDSEIFKSKGIKIREKIANNLAKLCLINNIKLIHISSIQVYKNFDLKKRLKIKSTKDYKSFYAKGHIATEKIFTNKLKNKKNSFIIIRLSNVFGFTTNMTKKYILENLINNLCYYAKKKKLIILKNPSIVRNVIPSKFFYSLINYIIRKNYFKNKIINYGYKSLDLKNISNLIAKQCKNKLKKNIKIEYKNYIKNKKFIIYDNILKRKYNQNEITSEINNILKNI